MGTNAPIVREYEVPEPKDNPLPQSLPAMPSKPPVEDPVPA
jgi:hypothetical protein